VDDNRQRIDRIAVHEDVSSPAATARSGHMIIRATRSRGDRLQLVVEVEDDLVEGQLVVISTRSDARYSSVFWTPRFPGRALRIAPTCSAGVRISWP